MTRLASLLPLLWISAAFAQTPVTPPGFQMPGGSGCAGEIARYRAVQENDNASGNVARSVYLQIKREIAAAEQVCAAGEDAKASAMVRASQARHGYSTHL
ncbi:MAG: hypothetical protein KGM15_09315 [Pseudomonadota bacterium]|nr:hypothetical protein [Pseudomonadota bacterium]